VECARREPYYLYTTAPEIFQTNARHSTVGALLRIASLRWRAASPTPKIGQVLALIALILFGVAVITVAALVLLRSVPAIRPRETQDPSLVESEVYEKLYGKRSGTVSAPLPVEPPPKSDADTPLHSHASADPRPRTPRASRVRDSHR
jgi:hypothetical protein